MIASPGQVWDVAKGSHTFWDSAQDGFIPTLFTDGAATRKQESPFRVNLELRDYELTTGTETDQVLERFWWEGTWETQSASPACSALLCSVP